MAITQYSFGKNLAAAASNNVRDIYKEWTAAEVRADLQENRTDLVTVLMNVTHDFNKASAIRSNNAFLGKEVYIVGRRKYNTCGDVLVCDITRKFFTPIISVKWLTSFTRMDILYMQ